MERMLLAGMNVARLNFSHGEFGGHKKVIDSLRSASRATGRRVAIMADLPGPKIRIGRIAGEPIELKPGDTYTLTTRDIPGDASIVSVTFEPLPGAVRPGDTIFLNDGLIQLEVATVEGQDVRCRVIMGGELRSRKGLNLPGIDLGISAFTDHDHECLRFAKEQGLDAVSQSFVEKAADIHVVRKSAEEIGYHPFIIAKIERSRALDCIEEIIDAADGIMIARGDLGVELPIEQIAVVQKRIMRLANMRAKPVITATQMLESMTSNRRPTRAEATDVSNAILDGTDCVMLSGESAMGSFPVEAVTMLARIAQAIEPSRHLISVGELYKGIDLKGLVKPAHLVALWVEAALEYTTPAAVFVPTRSGTTARSISRFRLPVWIAAVSSLESTCQQLQFSYGVFPLCETDHPDDWNAYIRQRMVSLGLTGDIVLLTEGPSLKHPGANHRVEIIDLNRA